MSDEPKQRPARYTLRPVTTPLPKRARDAAQREGSTRKDATPPPDDPFIRPEAEDDDGYDPYSDRPPAPEPTFEEDPWR